MPDQDSARQLRPILHYVPPFSTLVVSPTASPRLGDIVYVYGSATVYCSPPPPPTAPPAWRALPSSAGPLTPPPDVSISTCTSSLSETSSSRRRRAVEIRPGRLRLGADAEEEAPVAGEGGGTAVARRTPRARFEGEVAGSRAPAPRFAMGSPSAAVRLVLLSEPSRNFLLAAAPRHLPPSRSALSCSLGPSVAPSLASSQRAPPARAGPPRPTPATLPPPTPPTPCADLAMHGPHLHGPHLVLARTDARELDPRTPPAYTAASQVRTRKGSRLHAFSSRQLRQHPYKWAMSRAVNPPRSAHARSRADSHPTTGLVPATNARSGSRVCRDIRILKSGGIDSHVNPLTVYRHNRDAASSNRRSRLRNGINRARARPRPAAC